MSKNIETSYLLNIEKSFTIFRWFLPALLTIMTFQFNEYNSLFSMFAVLFVYFIFNTFITIVIFTKKEKFYKVLDYAIYLDVLVITVLMMVRGGLRSDIYASYFVIITYGGARHGYRETLRSLALCVFAFWVVTFYYTPEEFFSLGRFVIRVGYLIVFTAVMLVVNAQVKESRIKEKEAKELASIDPLTKLPNRLALSDNFQRLERINKTTGQLFAISMIDIDNFKKINDRIGHIKGDEVLANLALILKGEISEDDFVCRFGGEEFLILFANAEMAGKKAEKIRAAIEASYVLGGDVSVSIGISNYMDKYTMIENIGFADEIMYEAKSKGKNQVLIKNDFL